MKEDGKYIRLFGTIFFSFIGFIAAFALLMVGLKYTFRILDHIPWFSLMFTLFIICVPAVLFITVYLIYIQHTKPHTSKSAKIFSYIIFAIALAAWIYYWFLDFIIFFKHHYSSIGEYHCYNLAFLAGNVGILFLVGIVQALSTKKELGWMEKNQEKEMQ
jgi:chromate transport protein ChrA